MTTIDGTLDDLTCERAVYDEQATNVLKDNEHLSLVLLANGSKQWRATLQDQNGISTVRFLGNYPEMNVANARQAALLQLGSTQTPPAPEETTPNEDKGVFESTPSANTAPQNDQDLFPTLSTNTPQAPELPTEKKAPTPKKNTATKASSTNSKTKAKKVVEVESPPPKIIKHTFSNTVRRWLKTNQERWKENRFQQIEKIAVTLLSPQLKPYDFKELTPALLRDCLENLANTQGKMVAREALLILKGVIEYAIEKNYLTRNPLENIQNQLSFIEVTKATKTTAAKTTTAPSVKKRVQTLKQKPVPQDKNTKPTATLVTSVPEVEPPTIEPVAINASETDTKPAPVEPVSHDAPPARTPPEPETEATIAASVVADSTPIIAIPQPEQPQASLHSPSHSTPVQIPLEEITLGYLLKKQVRSLLQHFNIKGMLGYIVVAAISSWLAMWLVHQEKELLLIKLDVTEKKLEVLENSQKHAQDTEQKLKTALTELQELANECRVDLKKALKNAKKE